MSGEARKIHGWYIEPDAGFNTIALYVDARAAADILFELDERGLTHKFNELAAVNPDRAREVLVGALERPFVEIPDANPRADYGMTGRMLAGFGLIADVQGYKEVRDYVRQEIMVGSEATPPTVRVYEQLAFHGMRRLFEKPTWRLLGVIQSPPETRYHAFVRRSGWIYDHTPARKRPGRPRPRR